VTDVDTFATRYKQMSDGELMQIAAERDGLAADAAIAIDAELSRRGFSIATAKKQAMRAERKGTRHAIGSLGFSARGYGKHFFGISDYHLDVATSTEEFDSTLWFWILWLPIVPLASYHIERHEHGKSLWWSLSKQPFSASNEAPPFMLHVLVGWAFSVVAAVAAFRFLLILLRLFR
jgi:hypothetical protein